MNDEFGEDLGAYFDDEEDLDCFGLDACKDAGNKQEFAPPESVVPESAELESAELVSAKPSTSNSSGNDGPDINFGGSLFYDGPEAEGFFLPTGSSYYYPTNFPVRDYQKSIIETALFNNTLVVLPTGLGKTFIAAVVMYNFYRWYPRGLVIFMAPTRPLVTQQINACTDIMGIPLSDITEITGKTLKTTRIDSWKEKRIFFVTPHVMVNDITNNYCDPTRVKCIVVDEAHKAMGNYAYCQIMKQLKDYFLKFRIVALSATPGNNPAAYQEVVHNLNIAKIQVRAEDSPDVAKYVHGRKLSHIVLKLDNVWKQFQDKFLQVYEDYSRVLKDNSVVKGNVSSLTTFQILTILEVFKKKKDIDQDVKSTCNLSLLACSTLAHAYSLLYTYGFKALYSHFTGESDSCAIPIIRKNDKLRSLLRAIDDYLKDNGSPMKYVPSHPKFVKLREVVANHFTTVEQNDSHTDTKVIIYCQFRVGVTEAHAALIELEPLVRPVMFIGQSSGKKGSTGLGQKAQLEILNNFKSGKFNTLIATCIGEEGLDIGEVDLIICIDAQSSITRHIQRIGRTGRKRAGACIFLVTEGKEEAKFKKCLSASSTFSKMINPSLLNTSVAGANPRMVPKHIKPKLHFVHIQPHKENKGKSKRVAQDDEEADEEASTSKEAPKRKKGKNEEKKEKQSKKAKLEKPANGRTLFSYFTKKTFDSFNENDEETKDVFSTPKDKQLLKKKPKSPELDNISEEDCAIIEENGFEDNVPSVFEANPGCSRMDFDHEQMEVPNDGPSTSANNSENLNEIEPMFTLFQKWVTNYAQNDDVLIDENFVQLVRLFMKKPGDYISTSDCDIVNNSTLASSPIDFGINFDSSSDDEVHESPVLLSRKVPSSSPVKVENQTKDPSYEIDSPVLSCSKVKAVFSPVHCNSKDIANEVGDNSPMMLPDRNKFVLTTSTPKVAQKRSFISSSLSERDSSNLLNQIPAQNFGKKIKTEVSEVSPSKPSISEDSESSSPLILTCKASKPANLGTAKTLFPEDDVRRNDMPLISECNAEQNNEKCKDENLEQFLSDSVDMFFGNDEEDVQPLPKVDENFISQDEILTQKENNAPNFDLNLEPKTVFSQEEAAEKPSLFTTIHSEKAKWFEVKKESMEKSGDRNWDATETTSNKAAVLQNHPLSCFKAVSNESNNVSDDDVFNIGSSVHRKSTVEFSKKHMAANAEPTKTVEVVSHYFNDEDDSIFENFTFNTSKIKASSNNQSEKLPIESDKILQSSGLNDLKVKEAVQPSSLSNSKANKLANSPKTDLAEATSQASSSEFFFLPKNKPSSSSLLTKSISNTKTSLSSRTNDLQSCPLLETKCKNLDTDLSSKFLLPPEKKEDSESRFPKFIPKSSGLFNGELKIKGNTAQAVKSETSHPVEKSNCFKNPADLGLIKSRNYSTSSHQRASGYSSFERSTIQRSISKDESKNSSFHSDSDDSDLFFEQRPVKVKKSDERPRKILKEKLESATAVVSKKPKKKKSEFIEWEAEVSGSDVSEDEHEGDEDASHMPDSFIHDGHNTVLPHEHTMTAQYLESIRSPEKTSGRFRIPVLPNRINKDVFSQTFHNDADYQNDSFCVDEEISEGYDGSEDELFDRDMKKAIEESKIFYQKEKISKKRKRIIDSSSSNDEVILLDSPTKEKKRCGDSEVVLISSGSSGEDNYTKKKPTRRKKSHSEKFSKFKKVIEARKSKIKPAAGCSKGESSRVLKPNPQQNNKVESVTKAGGKDDSDTDCDDFLPRPGGSGLSLNQRKGMETSVIGKKTKKVVKLNLFSSDED